MFAVDVLTESFQKRHHCLARLFLKCFQSNHKGYETGEGVYQTGSLIRRLCAWVLRGIAETLSRLVVHRNVDGVVACKASPTTRREFSATNLYDCNVSQMGDTSFCGGVRGCGSGGT